jgi:hypothetical protein
LIKCPVCGLSNPDAEGRCDCGFDFPRQVVIVNGREMPVTEVGSRTISRGIAVLVGGVIALGLASLNLFSGNPDNFLTVYVVGALLTLALGVHQVVRGIGLRSRGKKMHSPLVTPTQGGGAKP